MIVPEDRERVEKARSALAAAHLNGHLLVSETQVARYLAASADAVHPLDYAFHLLGDVKGKTVLEYGCGDGLNTVVLCRRGANVIGLDISPELLAVAKERLIANQCDGTFILGSAHALPLPDESVDVVFGIAILHHLDLEMASREVQRVLKKRGKGIFQEPLRNSKFLAMVRRLFPPRADVSPLERPLTDQEMRNFAGTCRYEAQTFHLILSRLATLVPTIESRLLKICERLDRNLLRLFPSLAYYGSIKVFEITKH